MHKVAFSAPPNPSNRIFSRSAVEQCVRFSLFSFLSVRRKLLPHMVQGFPRLPPVFAPTLSAFQQASVVYLCTRSGIVAACAHSKNNQYLHCSMVTRSDPLCIAINHLRVCMCVRSPCCWMHPPIGWYHAHFHKICRSNRVNCLAVAKHGSAYRRQ